MIEPYYQEDGITLYCGDCLAILPTLKSRSAELILTDFPYGNATQYENYLDDANNLIYLIDAALPEIFRVSDRTLITCGVSNIRLFPRADWILCWYSSAGIGSGPWGFCCWQPILVYGKDPYLSNGLGRRPDSFSSNEHSEKFNHPCAKPISLWKSLLLRGSCDEGDTILDPFCGSGTTLVAAKQLGRKAIGIEISERYCEIAVKRLAQMELNFEDSR